MQAKGRMLRPGQGIPGDIWRIAWRAQRGPVTLSLRAYGWLAPLARAGWLGALRVEEDPASGALRLGPWPEAPHRPAGLVRHVWEFPVSRGTLAIVQAWPWLGSPGVDPLEQIERWAQAQMGWSARGCRLRPWVGRTASVRVRVWGPGGLRPQPGGVMRLEAGVRLRRAASLPAYARAERWAGRGVAPRLRAALARGTPGGAMQGIAHDLLAEHRALAARLRTARQSGVSASPADAGGGEAVGPCASNTQGV